MKEKYLRPAVISAKDFEGEGIIPAALAPAAALLGGYVVGRAVAKVLDARPNFKLPSLTEGRRVK
ncbi:MAG: hypothetical protein IJQ82_12450 [Selenomonadaceae bacterium]|nr:hypothetical protein [Selenomonadaceae bacterium]